jgi:hypothetical protein
MKVGDVFCLRLCQRLPFTTDGEDESSEEAQKKLGEKFKPLINWLKEETTDIVRDGESLYNNCRLVAHDYVSSRHFESARHQRVRYRRRRVRLYGQPGKVDG